MKTVHIQLTGNLGADPEYVLTGDQHDRGVVKLRLAVDTYAKDDAGEWVTGEPVWYKVQLWGTVAAPVADQLRQGDRVAVTSYRPITVDQWITRDGETRCDMIIRADDVALSTRVDQRITRRKV